MDIPRRSFFRWSRDLIWWPSSKYRIAVCVQITIDTISHDAKMFRFYLKASFVFTSMKLSHLSVHKYILWFLLRLHTPNVSYKIFYDTLNVSVLTDNECFRTTIKNASLESNLKPISIIIKILFPLFIVQSRVEATSICFRWSATLTTSTTISLSKTFGFENISLWYIYTVISIISSTSTTQKDKDWNGIRPLIHAVQFSHFRFVVYYFSLRWYFRLVTTCLYFAE